MKKKLLIFLGILLLFIICNILWWKIPIHFLDTNEIVSIKVFNGTNGNGFEISDKEHVDYIVKNIQNSTFKKEKISLMHMGTYYNLTFLDKEGKTIDKFIINSDDTLRKDPFFYHTENINVIHYIESLEPIPEE